MFTGIIEEVGSLKKLQKEAAGAVFEISCKRVLEGLQIGDSIAANGVCLTATAFTSHSFTAAAMHETLRRSTLGNLHPGSPINLERAMAANGRFGGHMVAGHIDGTGTISSVQCGNRFRCLGRDQPDCGRSQGGLFQSFCNPPYPGPNSFGAKTDRRLRQY